jgi:hypothetical protein
MQQQQVDIKDLQIAVNWSRQIGITTSEFFEYALHLGVLMMDEMLKSEDPKQLSGFAGIIYKKKLAGRRR